MQREIKLWEYACDECGMTLQVQGKADDLPSGWTRRDDTHWCPACKWKAPREEE